MMTDLTLAWPHKTEKTPCAGEPHFPPEAKRNKRMATERDNEAILSLSRDAVKIAFFCKSSN